MSEDKTGGSAFPQVETESRYNEYGAAYSDTQSIGGMTLRDYFAAKALQGNLAYSWHNPMRGNFQENCDAATLAKVCYELADAMLAERIK